MTPLTFSQSDTPPRIDNRFKHKRFPDGLVVEFKSEVQKIEEGLVRTRPLISIYETRFDFFMKGSDVFVDQSLLIKDVLTNPHDVIFISKPKRWSKSLNLAMIGNFLEIEFDEDGNAVPEHEKVNGKFFSGGEVEVGYDDKKLFRKLKIANHPEIISKYQGKFPVIHIGLRDISIGDDVETAAELIDEIFEKHEHLYRSFCNTTLEAQKRQLARYTRRFITIHDLGKPELENSLRFLTEILSKCYQSRVFVLVDDCTHPIYEAYDAFGDPECDAFTDTVQLFRSIFNKAFINNPFLEKAVLTGKVEIAGAQVFSDLTSFAEYNTLTDNVFSQYYGFIQEEVDELITKVPLWHDPAEIKCLYNGYNFKGKVIYNPRVVSNYLVYGSAALHEAESTTSGISEQVNNVLTSDEFQQTLHRLLQGKSIKFKDFINKISPDGVETCRKMLYTVLVMDGYLNPIPIRNDQASTTEYHLVIPNRQVGILYTTSVKNWIINKFPDMEVHKYFLAVKFLVQGQIDDFKEIFSEYLSHKKTLIGEEDFYNLMKGTVSTLSWGHFYWKTEFILWTDIVVGDEHSYMLVPKIARNYAPFRKVLETPVYNVLMVKCKVISEKKDLQEVAKKGLNQLKDVQYSPKMKDKIDRQNHLEKFIKLSVAFCGNEVVVEYEVEYVALVIDKLNLISV